MGRAQEVHYQGKHYQVDIVKKMLLEEINLYERRIIIIKRASLKGQESLIKTYQDMIDARDLILKQLDKMTYT